MDPNNPNQTTSQSDSPQSTAPQPDTTQQVPLNPQPNTPPPTTPPEVPTASQPDPNTQVNPSPQANTDTSLTDGSYAEDIGDKLIYLLDDINSDENLLQMVANEMELDKEKVKGILTKLLDKIDQEQITTEELALIMASTVADETSNQE
jgi:hypothetical protein